MKEIKLTQGKFALVDDKDFKWLNQFKWSTKCYGGAERRINHKLIPLHRFILNPPKGKVVDHINHNPFDNRRENLRICTQKQNVWNQLKQKRSTSSKYKGVNWDKQMGKWKTRVNRKFIGLFDSELHAAMAYDLNAKALFGEYASLNF